MASISDIDFEGIAATDPRQTFSVEHEIYELLHLAATDVDTDTLRSLLHRFPGLAVDARSSPSKFTPLFVAATNRPSNIGPLLAAGADPNVANVAKNTPLHSVCAGEGRVAYLRELMDAGATMGYDKAGMTAMHTASEKGDLDMVRALVDEYGVDVNLMSTRRISPLMCAAAAWKTDIVEYLLERGADPHTVTQSGHNVLCLLLNPDPRMVAKEYFRTPDAPHGIVRMLLERGVDPNSRLARSSFTALHMAIIQNLPDIMELLLDHGADAHVVTQTGDTAWNMCDSDTGKVVLQEHASRAALELLKEEAAGPKKKPRRKRGKKKKKPQAAPEVVVVAVSEVSDNEEDFVSCCEEEEAVVMAVEEVEEDPMELRREDYGLRLWVNYTCRRDVLTKSKIQRWLGIERDDAVRNMLILAINS